MGSENPHKHHHHHHHHHSHREKKNKKWILPAVIIVSAVVVVTAIILTSYVRSSTVYAVTGTSSPNTDLRFQEVEYKGDKYRYNNRIITILLAGLDSEGPLVETRKYGDAARADSINLIVIDTQQKKLSIIGLDRNTITEMRKFSIGGWDRGLFRDFLCRAYSYGNGGNVSCENLREAVSLLLYDVPVNRYVMANRSSFEGLAELVGPVEVTVPNDDLVEIDPKYKKGSVVVVDASNIEKFLRYRDTSRDFTNEGRMERQKAYLTAAADQILETLTAEPQESWKKIQQMEEFIQTDITRNQYLDLVNDLKEVDRDSIEYIIPEGTLSAENYYDEFYLDQEKLLDEVVNIFYRKQ